MLNKEGFIVILNEMFHVLCGANSEGNKMFVSANEKKCTE